MTKHKNSIYLFTSFVVIATVLSLVAGAGGSYFVLRYFGTPPQPQERVTVEKETVTQYVPEITHEQKIIDVVERVSGGVVSVIAAKDVPVFEQFFRSPFENDPFFREFFPEFQIPEQRQRGTEKQQISAGTGFAVAEDGFIITNKHVVSDEDAEYTIITKEGEKYPAEVLARDPVQDLAVLKIEAGILSSLTLGDSENLKTGQTVIAIGNALGEFQNTVSVGVISGLRRTIVASSGFGESETLEEVIQTDAAINPGNSGGPLLNLSGQVIGVNVAIASGAENIGFAIPINRAKKAIQDVETKGKITYPFLGVRYVPISEQFAKESMLPVDYGALVSRGKEITDLAVIPGSAADKAGIMENDIILEINGVKITEDYSLAKAIQSYSVGDVVTLKILHRGEEKKVQAVLGER